jgi:hypothetical protein
MIKMYYLFKTKLKLGRQGHARLTRVHLFLCPGFLSPNQRGLGYETAWHTQQSSESERNRRSKKQCAHNKQQQY